MEEDAGKSVHAGGDGRVHGADYSLIDLNRAGVPLVEIVSRPDIRSPEQAREYVSELRAILLAIGASDAKMEEGSMRVDANVSVRKPGEPLGTRCEIKNVNSIRSIGRAIEYEAKRQIQMLRARRDGPSADAALGRGRQSHAHAARQGRSRRLPLLPRARPRAVRARRRSGSTRCVPRLPMLPAASPARLAEVAGVPSTSEAVTSIVERGQDDYALAVVAAGGDAGRTVVHLKEAFAELGPEPDVPAADLAALTRLEVAGTITATQAKSVLARMIEDGGGNAEAIAPEMGFEAMDTSAFEAIVDEAIAGQPDAWAKYLAGERKALGAIVGQVMKASKGQADGKLVNEIVARRAAARTYRPGGNRTSVLSCPISADQSVDQSGIMVVCSIR